ncbi:hypothetical protein EJ05DRAFT_475806 [Pseudovirgaria hyperparasitica]|uniref:IEC3 subunit of the Ino80 complex, chromatin re-modelling-domain-containing protein n=1 Tax=Pseudovirgaria hyperparasitica TaxID=470096 RepID=A0A6A6W990_9PEZI|nr:uncharacterized protein EJ05DRAFT_475806 [Pseudovirgaria hyperparasitica]KAF2758500.1 hypothetical protein EJ05DRAFT_475806 [Pseudovirgaria hyperparasitica]
MASAQESLSATPANAPSVPQDPNKSQKSLRRKYQKIRWMFKNEMQSSNELIREEHRSMALARRLQEQIDELQELLLDINEEKRLPQHFNYDIRSPSPSASVVPSLETEQDPNASRGKSRNGTTNGDAPDRLKPKSLSYLLEHTPHTHYPAEHLPEDLLGDELPGYMTPAHEEEHLMALDSVLADPSSSSERGGRPIHMVSKVPIPSEKEVSVSNPDSAYNWLRRYQPQVFLQDPKPDNEVASEKSAPRATGAARGKRKSEAKGSVKPEEDVDEETAFIEAPVVTGRGGRKSKGGDDDAAYKPPKGGKGGKRKRDPADRESTSSRKKARNSGS